MLYRIIILIAALLLPICTTRVSARWDPDKHPNEAMKEARRKKDKVTEDYIKNVVYAKKSRQRQGNDGKYKNDDTDAQDVASSSMSSPPSEETAEEVVFTVPPTTPPSSSLAVLQKATQRTPINTVDSSSETLSFNMFPPMEVPQFTRKHYIVFGIFVISSFAIYTAMKRYRLIYLSERSGSRLNIRDLELTLDDETNPFIDRSTNHYGGRSYVYHEDGSEF
jgi:hypothetical protein